MLRTSLVLSALIAIVSGCGRDNSATPAGGHNTVQALPVIAPKSGGDMVLLPAGSFTMGDPAGRPDETPHRVSLSSFYMDGYAVTQELFEKVMGVNPSKRKSPMNPVEKVQWTDAVRFCNKCSEWDGLTPCYNLDTWECNFAADGYRLPTEAEWEYACRAGGDLKFGVTDDESALANYAWFRPLSENKTHPVGQKAFNRWGLYDMNGNVWQWCHDWYSPTYYRESAAQDPHGPSADKLPAQEKMRVLRGGACDSPAEKCRAAYRHKEFPVYSDACFGTDSNGFRRARGTGGGWRVTGDGTGSTKPAGNDQKPDASPLAARHPSPATRPASLKGTIVFVSDRGGTLNIWSMRASGKDVKQLTHGKEGEADPRFAPDGKRILYTTLRGGFPEIWIMNRDGSNPKAITKGSQASWAPDGKSIIFIRDNQTFIRDLASEKERLVTPANWERCGVPAFSPDGKRFAVASRHRGTIGIFILSLDGKETTPLKTDEACCTPYWSKDGKKMLCQSDKGHVHEASLDGKAFDQVTFGNDIQHDARYSPDGTMILFCRAPTPEGPWQICLRRLDGDDDDFVRLTTEGSNLQPDWQAAE